MSQVQQSSNRNVDRLPPVKEFILMRRCTIGAALVEGRSYFFLPAQSFEMIYQGPLQQW